MSKYSKQWEMREGGPYGEKEFESEIFKCTGCGAETAPEKGFDGEPNLHNCSHDCQMHHGDQRTDVTDAFRENYKRMTWGKSRAKVKSVNGKSRPENLFRKNFENNHFREPVPGRGM